MDSHCDQDRQLLIESTIRAADEARRAMAAKLRTGQDVDDARKQSWLQMSTMEWKHCLLAMAAGLEDDMISLSEWEEATADISRMPCAIVMFNAMLLVPNAWSALVEMSACSSAWKSAYAWFFWLTINFCQLNTEDRLLEMKVRGLLTAASLSTPEQYIKFLCAPGLQQVLSMYSRSASLTSAGLHPILSSLASLLEVEFGSPLQELHSSQPECLNQLLRWITNFLVDVAVRFGITGRKHFPEQALVEISFQCITVFVLQWVRVTPGAFGVPAAIVARTCVEDYDINRRKDMQSAVVTGLPLLAKAVQAELSVELEQKAVKKIWRQWRSGAQRYKPRLGSFRRTHLPVYCSYCNKKESGTTALKKCASCHCTRYCSRDCQSLHWPFHKAICKRLAKQNGASLANS